MEFLQELDWMTIINSGLTLLFAVGTWYFNKTTKGAELKANIEHTYSEIKGHVEEKIVEAESLSGTLDGSGKFNWVVDQLYKYVPTAFQPFITKDMVGDIVQASFDKIQEFAIAQIDKNVSSKSVKKVKK